MGSPDTTTGNRLGRLRIPARWLWYAAVVEALLVLLAVLLVAAFYPSAPSKPAEVHQAATGTLNAKR